MKTSIQNKNKNMGGDGMVPDVKEIKYFSKIVAIKKPYRDRYIIYVLCILWTVRLKTNKSKGDPTGFLFKSSASPFV